MEKQMGNESWELWGAGKCKSVWGELTGMALGFLSAPLLVSLASRSSAGSLAPLRARWRRCGSLLKAESYQPKGNRSRWEQEVCCFEVWGASQQPPNHLLKKWMWGHWKRTCKCSCDIKLFRTKEIVFFKGEHLCEGTCLLRLIWFFKTVHLKWRGIKKPSIIL